MELCNKNISHLCKKRYTQLALAQYHASRYILDTSVSGGIETSRWGNIVFRQSYSLICVRHVLSSLVILQNMLHVMSVMSHVMCVMTQVMSCMPCHMTHNMYNVCIICLIVIRIIRKQLMIVSNMDLACHIMSCLSCHTSCDITCHM